MKYVDLKVYILIVITCYPLIIEIVSQSFDSSKSNIQLVLVAKQLEEQKISKRNWKGKVKRYAQRTR